MIAFLINELDIRGGTHKQFLKLLEYTAKQTDDFFIVTKRVDFDKTYPGFKEFENKIRIFVPQMPDKTLINRLRTRSKNIKILRSIIKDADIINLHDQGFERLFSAFKGKKVVWQINDLPSCFNMGVNKNINITWKTKFIKRSIVNRSKFFNKITVNVSKNRARIRSAFNRDAEVLYCGIEPINIHRDIDKTFDRLKNNKVNLLSSGVFFPYRNYETQIKVVQNLVDSGYDIHLNIIGSTNRDKTYSDKIRKLIKDSGLENNITIWGQVDEITFKKLHENADMFLFVNIDQSWGLAVFEAMSSGLPVIVSESVGATEILANGENALFVNPLDSIEITNLIKKLAQNFELYKLLSNNGKNFHKKYTWDKAYSEPMFNILLQS